VLAPVVHTRSRYVRVSDPVLNLFQVRVVFKRVGDGGSAQRVRTEAVDVDAHDAGVFGEHLVDAVRCDRPAGAPGVVTDGAEQRRRLVVAVAGRLEVADDCAGRRRVQRQVANLAAFAEHAQVPHPAALLQVDLVQRAQFGAAQAVVEQCGQHRAIAQALEGRAVRRRQQCARLVIADRRRPAFLTRDLRSLHAVDRVALDRVGFAQCIEQRRQRRELATDRRAAQRALLEVMAPGQYVAAADLAERGSAMPANAMNSRTSFS
jgi:hypothetical protein